MAFEQLGQAVPRRRKRIRLGRYYRKSAGLSFCRKVIMNLRY